jgi:hypothetical protein
MYMNTTFSNFEHSKSILSDLKFAEGLPFSKILSSESIIEVTRDLEYRNRIYSPEFTLWTFLSQVLDDDQSLQAAVARVAAFFVAQGRSAPSINTSAYSQARTRFPKEVLEDLTRDSGKQLEKNVPSNWRWQDKPIKLIDGSTVSMPDTEENQLVYPQQSAQKPGVGFPIARILAIISYATGAVLDLAIGPFAGKGTGEHALLRQLLDVFEEGDIAIGDKYFPSYYFMCLLKKMGVDGVFPLHFRRHNDFRKGKKLGKKDHIVFWEKSKKPEWMDEETYKEFPEHLEIREVFVQNSQKGFRTKGRILITTFLEPKFASAQILSNLYDNRWSVEIDLRSIKDVMHMGVLRGKTPEMVRKEIWAHLLAYNLIRKIMAQAAVIYKKQPRQLSFKLTLQLLEAFRAMGIFQENNQISYSQFLRAVVNKTIGNRPGRQEPRRIKRRPKPYPLLMKPRQLYRKKAA